MNAHVSDTPGIVKRFGSDLCRLVLALATVSAGLSLGGCATKPLREPTPLSVAPTPVPAQTESDATSVAPDLPSDGASSRPKVSFMDSRVFDHELSRTMLSEPEEILVDVPTGFHMNQIPERVDRWLFAVKDSGGEVRAEPEVRTRGLLGMIIDVVVSVFSKIDEMTTFAPSENYTATLLYRPDGTVRKMVFKRRPVPAFELVSPDEIARVNTGPVPAASELKSHGSAPDIRLIKPGKTEPVMAPLDLELHITSKDLAQIDMNSLRVFYGQPGIEVTKRLRQHATVESSRIKARALSLPAGPHLTTVEITDVRHRLTRKAFLVDVAQENQTQ